MMVGWWVKLFEEVLDLCYLYDEWDEWHRILRITAKLTNPIEFIN